MSKNKITSHFTTTNVQIKLKQEPENSEILKCHNVDVDNNYDDIAVEKQQLL